eukprot:Opistho-2@69558
MAWVRLLIACGARPAKRTVAAEVAVVGTRRNTHTVFAACGAFARIDHILARAALKPRQARARVVESLCDGARSIVEARLCLDADVVDVLAADAAEPRLTLALCKAAVDRAFGVVFARIGCAWIRCDIAAAAGEAIRTLARETIRIVGMVAFASVVARVGIALVDLATGSAVACSTLAGGIPVDVGAFGAVFAGIRCAWIRRNIAAAAGEAIRTLARETIRIVGMVAFASVVARVGIALIHVAVRSSEAGLACALRIAVGIGARAAVRARIGIARVDWQRRRRMCWGKGCGHWRGDGRRASTEDAVLAYARPEVLWVEFGSHLARLSKKAVGAVAHKDVQSNVRAA